MNRRGLSLAEVLVAGAIFVGLAFLVLLIMTMGQRSHRLSETHSDAYRTALVALEKIRAEIRGGIVLSAAGPRLEYKYIPRGEGVVLDFTGHPIYAGPAVLRLDGTVIVREEQPGPDPADLEVTQLVDLGEGGELEFEMESGRVLRVRVRAVRPDPQDRERDIAYQQSLKIYLDNQP